MKHIPSDLLNYIVEEVFEENILGTADADTHYKVSVNTEFSIFIKNGKMAAFLNNSKEPIKINHSCTKKANIVNFKFMVRHVNCLSGSIK